MCTNHAVVKITPDKGNVNSYFSRVSKRFSCSISLAGNCAMIIHTLPILGQYNTRHLGGYARNIPSPLHNVGCVCLGLSSHYEL